MLSVAEVQCCVKQWSCSRETEFVLLCLKASRPQTLCNDAIGTNSLTVLALCLPSTFIFVMLFGTEEVVQNHFAEPERNMHYRLHWPFLQEFLAWILHHWMQKTGFPLIKKQTNKKATNNNRNRFHFSQSKPLLVLLEAGEIYSRCFSSMRIITAFLKWPWVYLWSSLCAPSSSGLGKQTSCSQ